MKCCYGVTNKKGKNVMRIAHVSPFFEEVSVESEGLNARSIAYLTGGLIRFGHDVTVFASGDSRVAGTLVPVSQLALRHYPSPKRHLSEGLTFLALEKAFSTTAPFDLIHVHAGFATFPLMRRSPIPIVATVYDSLDGPEVVTLYREFKELPLVATSEDQIRHCPDLNWQTLIPWKSPSLGVERFGEEFDSFVETAMAYTAVYDRVITTAVERRRPVQPTCSLQGAVSRL